MSRRLCKSGSTKLTSCGGGERGRYAKRLAEGNFDLCDLIDRITEENTHEETDTGPPVGNEVW